MATIPLSGTDIRLIKGVPFSSDYKHSRYFTSLSTQLRYFVDKPIVHKIDHANFQREDNIGYVNVNKDVDSLHATNYIMFRNSSYTGKWFYGFVTKLEYVQRNMTRVHFEIDVYQTWRFDINIKPSYVVREHCPLWNADGSPYVNTIDEGLDYGEVYETVAYKHYRVNDGLKWLVIASKTVLHDDIVTPVGQIQPSVIGIIQPLTYYLVPFTKENDGLSKKIKVKTILGDTVTVDTIATVLKELYENENAVNNVVSLYITDNIGVPLTFVNNTINFTETQAQITDETIGKNTVLLSSKFIPDFVSTGRTIYDNFWIYFENVRESKLLMSPYSIIEIDDMRGGLATLKPEYIMNKALRIISMGSIGTSNKVSYSVQDYKTDFPPPYTQIRAGLEDGLIDNSPNDVPIINDYLASFLQGNRNVLDNQRHSTLWNGAFDVGGSIASMPFRPISGAINAIKGAGDTVLKLQGANAKLKDIDNTPPSISKMGGNTGFDFGNNIEGVWIKHKQIKKEYRDKLSDFFNMYGYKVHRVKIPNMNTRRYWNYVQTEDITITGDLNNNDLIEIKSVFDNGITLWHTDDVGNYALINEVK